MSYFESRIPVDFTKYKEIKTKLKVCEELGIKNIILEPINNIDKIPSDIREKVQSESKFNIFFRINLRLRTLEEFKQKIRKFNNFLDILSIESPNKEVQLHSAKDSRVDLISFSDPEILKTLTPGVISLTKQNNSFIEFSLAPIMISNKTVQSKNFRNLYKNVQFALNLKANLIISGNFINRFDYRHPRGLISICNSLLGIPVNITKEIYINNPQKLVGKSNKRNSDSLNKKVNE